jgi:DNA polymerase-3 subunit epsilon
MKTVLICDVETTGVDREKDRVIELGCIRWSVEYRTILELFSGLVSAPANPAEAVNGIPEAALVAYEGTEPWQTFEAMAARSDAVCAHQADFDRAFCEPWATRVTQDMTWICTREDVKWPRAGTGTSLIATALAHGVAVVAAHRAINDCLTLVRLFEAVPDIAERLEAGLAHAMLPKARLVSLAPYEDRAIVKDNGFKWDPQRREWWRYMCVEDSAALPFRCREVPL